MSFKMQSVLGRLRKSWTLYLNLISALLAGAEMQFHLLKDVIGEESYPVAYFGLIMLNIALRFRTEMKHYNARLKEE